MVSFASKIFKREWIITLFVLSIFISILYYKVLQNPNHFLVASGDGMKNYYTFMYHVKHDSSFMTFEGMNYPFGENIIFTDNQPLISNTTKIFAKIFPEILCYLPAIHNLTLLFGIVFGGLGLFCCFRYLKIEFYFALLCALGLIALNPQTARFSAHFSMFYPVLPWIFYLWMLFWEGKRPILISSVLGLIITLSGLLHMYYFITGSILTCLSIFIYYFNKGYRGKFLEIIKVSFLQVILPFILLTFLSSYFNHSSDRPNDPWGFFTYHSSWEGLFFSYKLPLFEFVNNNITKVRMLDGEGKNYIGLASVLIILYGFYQIIFKYKSFIAYINGNNLVKYFTWIFVLTSLISFGYPFTISGFEWLLDYTGPFKQFRSIGRVGWVSFYAINFLSIPLIYHWLKDKKIQPLLLYTIPMIVLCEGIMYSSKKEFYQTNLESYQCSTKLNLPLNGQEYQATIADPYFHIGSECFSWSDQSENINQTFKIGYNLALPSMGVNMSRTSFHQALLLNELVTLPTKVPEIINIIKTKSSKPLLVIESKLNINDQRSKLSHWTKNAPVVFENEEFKLRKLDLNVFEQVVKKYNDSISQLKIVPPTIYKKLKFEKIKGATGWGYESYPVFDSIVPARYVISYEMECPDATYVLSVTEAWQYNKIHEQLEYTGEGNRFNYKKINGNKILFEIPVNMKSETDKIAIKISKFNQKEKQILRIENAHIRSEF